MLILADVLTGLLFILGTSYYRVGLPLKSAVVFFVFFYYLRQLNRKTIQSIYLLMVILFFFWLIGSLFSFNNNPEFDYAYSLVVLNRYYFLLILALIFVDMSDREDFNDTCRNVLTAFFLMNNLIIFSGALFHIDMFSTYDPLGEIVGDQRFGYKGLIHGGNDVAGIYILGMAYFFRERFKYKRPVMTMLVMTTLAAVMTGTKATLLGAVGFSGYYLIKYRFQWFVILITPMLMLAGYLAVKYWEIIKVKILAYTLERIHTMGLLTFLMSGRNQYLERHFKFILSNWSPVNFLTGDAFLYSETDLIDLYYFFGVGLVLYLVFYSKLFFLRERSWDQVFIYCVLLALAFTAGHIIQSAVVPLFLLLFIFSVKPDNPNDQPGHYRIG